MQNHLKNQTSPYLLQHVNNPVDWYPWCDEAFERAKREDKPVFLSIGYSTCHWCHVMAHESFEDKEVAEILNQYFVSIKVDKEERPDIDSIYMSVCQAFTGSGGWPTSIFMTPEQKPFFAGTYFPKANKYGRIGFLELLLQIHEKWETDRKRLLQSAEEVIAVLNREETVGSDVNEQLIATAYKLYQRAFDDKFGGFGQAPKFPTPHNLLFLMRYYEKSKDAKAMKMVEKTLIQMYRGGMFDHIGGGFSRYSTDRYYLVPHFEKMLYDNALLILAYCKAYQLTEKPIYREVAEKTASYILMEMTSPEGGFYCAQDADSEGIEGKYYLFKPSEIISVLGEEVGQKFNEYFDITENGNFEGENIPNLLSNQQSGETMDNHLSMVYEYRKKRYALHLDDKVLTSWNGLMIAAMCHLYRVSKKRVYLEAAMKAQQFLMDWLCEDGALYVSYRENRRSGKGFLDDYANEIFALIALYEATLEGVYLDRAREFCEKVIGEFYDEARGGFFLYGEENEQLIIRPKETYDGAVPSGNSMMAYNLVWLHYLTGEERFRDLAECQLKFLSGEAKNYPIGYAMFLTALSDDVDSPDKITVVLKNGETPEDLPCRIPLNTVINILLGPTEEYPLKNDQITYYRCVRQSCHPPVNEISFEI